jgi:hypothetical protein
MSSAVPANIRPGEIGILIATRGRPQLLAEVFRSLQANTVQKDKVKLWMYIDDDDAITRQAIDGKTLPDCGCEVHWHVGSRPSSLGETHETLWRVSGGTSQICMTSVDDARFGTPGWDDITRAKFDEHPDGVLLAFPHDPMTADQATYPILGWNWIRTLGKIYPTYFPYWFGDKWLDQIGRMAGRCAKVPMNLDPVGGKGLTKRMRNLPFWTLFFHLTLPERKESARRLVEAIHGPNGAGLPAALQELESAAKPFVKEKEDFSDVYCVFQEERFTEMTPAERDRFDPKLFQAECGAVSLLVTLAESALAQGRPAEAIECLDATYLSDLRLRNVPELKAVCLRAMGREAEAKRIGQELLVAGPQAGPVRRTARFFGMVANDGKRMVVGMTAKGKRG